MHNENYPGYSTFSLVYSKHLHLRKGDYWFDMLAPGNNGEVNTVSFQTTDGRWIVDEGASTVAVIQYQDTVAFSEISTFLLHKIGGSEVHVALESCIRRGYFMQNNGGLVNMQPNNSHYGLRNLWILSDRCK